MSDQFEIDDVFPIFRNQSARFVCSVSVFSTLRQEVAGMNRLERVDYDLLDSVPEINRVDAGITFRRLDMTPRYWISNEELAIQLGKRNLTLAHPVLVARWNFLNPGFADNNTNGTYWRDNGGKWCALKFNCYKYTTQMVRTVFVGNHAGWFDGEWIALVSKT